MNFNFNFKDMPPVAAPSIRGVTNERDLHRTAKSGIKRVSQRQPRVHAVAYSDKITQNIGTVLAAQSSENILCRHAIFSNR
jgi:hypothetical protein